MITQEEREKIEREAEQNAKASMPLEELVKSQGGACLLKHRSHAQVPSGHEKSYVRGYADGARQQHVRTAYSIMVAERIKHLEERKKMEAMLVRGRDLVKALAREIHGLPQASVEAMPHSMFNEIYDRANGHAYGVAKVFVSDVENLISSLSKPDQQNVSHGR